MFSYIKTIAIGSIFISSVVMMTGCVAYTPVPYAGYGGYGRGVAPVMPAPMFGGGWGHRGYGHHHH